MSKDVRVPLRALDGYLQNLIDKVFKILPMKEEQCSTLPSYLRSLESELVGCYKLWDELADEPQFFALINVVNFLAVEECDVAVCKREVFKAIHLVESVKKNIREEG